MELTAQTLSLPIGAKVPLEITWKNDDLPTGVTISSATKAVTPATGLTVTNPAVNSAQDGVSVFATAETAGTYAVIITATRSDTGILIALWHVTVVAATKSTALASNALVTVEDLARVMGEDVQVGLAEMVINSVSQEFERYIGRVIKQVTHTALYLDGAGSKYLNFPTWPAASLGTVTEDGTLLTEGADEDYLLYTSDDSAYLYKVSGVWLKGPKTVLISTVALGYATVPADLQMACLKQAAVEYQKTRLKGWNETSRSIEGGSVSLVDPGLLPDVVAVLKRYTGYGL